MPRIDELPNASSVIAPGWAYVPDTGFDPSKAAINPSQARGQRAARAAAQPKAGAVTGSDLSARQQAAIQRHLAELDKDGFKDVQLPAGAKGAERVKGKTPAVKRILLSQKTFANHLADEQAMLALQASQPAPTTSARSAADAAGPPKSARGRPIATAKSRRASELATSSPATPSADTVASRPSAPATPQLQDGPQRHSLHPIDPLAFTDACSLPSEEEIAALLDAPALLYSAARAAPPGPNATPQRRFCEMCGYWGRVKCMKCGARVCGLECRLAHDESRCQRFYG